MVNIVCHCIFTHPKAMDGYFSLSAPYPDITDFNQANTTFINNQALTGGAITLMRNVQVISRKS